MQYSSAVRRSIGVILALFFCFIYFFLLEGFSLMVQSFVSLRKELVGPRNNQRDMFRGDRSWIMANVLQNEPLRRDHVGR